MRAFCHGGLTLVELLLVLTVIGVLTAVAWPGLSSVIMDTRRAARANELVGLLNHARQSSIQRNRTVALCPSEDGASCGRDWTQGILIFEVRPGWRDTRPVEETDRITWSQPYLGPILTLSNRNRFTFRPGRRRSTNGTVVVCDPEGRALGRSIVIAPTGRVRTHTEIPEWVTVCR